MNGIFFDAEREREFAGRGYIVVPLFSAGEARALRAKLDAAKLVDAFRPNSPHAEARYHTSYFEADIDYKKRALAFARDALAGPVAGILRGYRMATGGFIVKPPGARNVALHRDWNLTADPDVIAVNVWCPLVDVGESNGALRLLAGTGRLVPNIETAGVEPFFAAYAHELMDRATPIPLRAGEALIFDNRTLHWSAPNQHAEPRIVLATSWVPQDSRLAFYALDESCGGRRFEIVDMEDDGFLEHTPAALAAGVVGRRSLGFVRNDNRPVSRQEFTRLLDERDASRRETSGSRSGLLGKARALFR